MDMEILAAVFSLMQCNNGYGLSFELNEITFKRHGCTCFLSSIALYKLWVEAHLLHFGRGIAILRSEEKTVVYGMITMGQGQASARRFCGIQ